MTEAAPAPERSIGVLVLGLGNVLLGDDGVGAAALARLDRCYRLPPGVCVADGGTLGLALLGLFTEARHAIIVDAVCAAAPPGTVVRLGGEEVAAAVRDRLSPHQVGVADLLDAARLVDRYPASVTLLGLVPETFNLGIGPSRAVEAGLDRLVDAVVSELRSLGCQIARRSVRADDSAAADIARGFGIGTRSHPGA